MRAQGRVIFKGIEKREGGVFKNDRGQEVKYDASYLVKFDEEKDGKIDERKLKFPATNVSLYDKFKEIKTYTAIELICDVAISNNASKLIPIEVNILK